MTRKSVEMEIKTERVANAFTLVCVGVGAVVVAGLAQEGRGMLSLLVAALVGFPAALQAIRWFSIPDRRSYGGPPAIPRREYASGRR